MELNFERHRLIRAELRKRGITLAQIALDMGKDPSSLSSCCIGRFYSQAIQEEISRRIERQPTELFVERYDKEGLPTPHKK